MRLLSRGETAFSSKRDAARARCTRARSFTRDQVPQVLEVHLASVRAPRLESSATRRGAPLDAPLLKNRRKFPRF